MKDSNPNGVVSGFPVVTPVGLGPFHITRYPG